MFWWSEDGWNNAYTNGGTVYEKTKHLREREYENYNTIDHFYDKPVVTTFEYGNGQGHQPLGRRSGLRYRHIKWPGHGP